MKRTLAVLVTATLVAVAARAAPAGYLGRWRSVDEQGKAKAVIELFEEGGEVKGRIAELLTVSPKEQPLCHKCEGEQHDKPMRGLVIISGMHPDGAKLAGGHIVDPRSGTSYRCTMELQGGGAQLKVRGYLGISLLGQSQIWQREPPR